MIISESIREWARKHDLQETLMIMGTGETIVFREEEMSIFCGVRRNRVRIGGRV